MNQDSILMLFLSCSTQTNESKQKAVYLAMWYTAAYIIQYILWDHDKYKNYNSLVVV